MTKEETSVAELYFNTTVIYKEKYGEKTIVFMQVGGFFEMYGYKEKGTIKGSNIEEVSDLIGFRVVDKKQSYKDCPIYMAGTTISTIDKHIVTSLENGYTVVTFVEVEIPGSKKKNRVLDNIFSPGTYVSNVLPEQVNFSNTIMCIWIETVKKMINVRDNKHYILVYGGATVNVISGKTTMVEYQLSIENDKKITPSMFDELHRYYTVNNPSECIIISKEPMEYQRKILDMIGCDIGTIHYKDPTIEPMSKNCEKQTFQKELLQQYFNVNTYDVCSEFRENQFGTQSYCYLLNFIKEHNPNLVKKIELPNFHTMNNRVVLANHTLSQLNIVEEKVNNSSSYGKKSSVKNFLNTCQTPMGKRSFNTLITNPTNDVKWLTQEYEMMEQTIEYYNMDSIGEFRKSLLKIKDVQKMLRQLVLRKMSPDILYELYQSMKASMQVIGLTSKLQTDSNVKFTKQLYSYLCSSIEGEYTKTNIESKIKKVREFIDTHCKIGNCAGVTNYKNLFDKPIINPDVDKEYKKVYATYTKYDDEFTKIYKYLERRLQKEDLYYKNTYNNHGYIKIEKTERLGCYLELTSVRAEKLIQGMQRQEREYEKSQQPDSDNKNMRKPIIFEKEIKFENKTKDGKIKRIEIPRLTELNKLMLEYELKLQQDTLRVYNNMMEGLDEYYDVINDIATVITKFDVLVSKVYSANSYHYCKPEIKEYENSYVHAYDLRHVLIEHLQQDEVYVTNDVCIGKPMTNEQMEQGFLLYGTNAVGKTSLIRALGIAVIMAQCGMYVPCSNFVYKPYNAIYSRILGNDNLFRGLSTFAVEMSELRVILDNADNSSLVLGDELCSGTEIQSALSIFVSGLEILYKQQSSFIFATHYHEITSFDEIKNMDKLGIKHMEVIYDKELDELVYDRKLKEGSGTKTYGLEVCKSLHLNNQFMERAYFLRNKYFIEMNGALNHKTSKYNAHKIRGMCELCGVNMSTEIHHIQHQQDADEHGYIGSVHKNHKANLLALCEECHQKQHHDEEDKVVRKKKTLSGKVVVT